MLVLAAALAGCAGAQRANTAMADAPLTSPTWTPPLPRAVVAAAPARVGPEFSLAAMVEDQLGRRLYPADRQFLDGAFRRVLKAERVGARRGWRNTHTGNAGNLELVERFADSDGGTCAVIEHAHDIDGASARGSVAACRWEGGWQMAGVEWQDAENKVAHRVTTAEETVAVPVRLPERHRPEPTPAERGRWYPITE